MIVNAVTLHSSLSCREYDVQASPALDASTESAANSQQHEYTVRAPGSLTRCELWRDVRLVMSPVRFECDAGVEVVYGEAQRWRV